MLQRKLLVVLGTVIALMLLSAVTAIGVLHATLEDLLEATGAQATETAGPDVQPAGGGAPAAAGEAGQTPDREKLEQLVHRFRIGGLIVGVVFLVLLNAAILVVLRTATMVLRPLDRLVAASRRWAREDFDHRIEVDESDEFGELARAYNALAEQLGTNEQRKLETLHQVARTLSHELNNAISTIELQLTLVDRRSVDTALAEPLRQIHQSLARMSRTIDALTRVRRIVLTDYISGIKMLDLERSVQDDLQLTPPATAPR